MTQVFIAYKRPDQDRVALVRQKLDALGVELFVDHQIKGGDNYIAVINAELGSALAALVFWSNAAVALPKKGHQNFLLAEAQRAWRRDILIAATFDKVVLDNLPVPFNTFQTSDLSDWFDASTPAGHRGWQQLLDALGAKIGRPGLANLALTLESGDERAKRDFIRAFPGDVFAERFADEVVAAERTTFNDAIAAAQAKIDRRKRDAEQVLKDCQRQFESQIVRLRKGESFVPPDPVKMLADEVTALRDENEIYERKIDELQDRVEQLKLSDVQSSEMIQNLAKQADSLAEQRVRADAAAAEAERMKSELGEVQRDVAEKASKLEEQVAEIEALKTSSAQMQQEKDAERRQTARLQSENVALRSQMPDAPWSVWKMTPRQVMGGGALVGVLLGSILAGTGGYYASARNKADMKPSSELQQRAKALDERQAKIEKARAEVAAEEKAWENAKAKNEHAIEAKESALKRRESVLAANEKRNDVRARELSQHAKQATQTKLVLNKRESALNNQDAVLSAKEQELVRREKVVELKEKDILRHDVAGVLGIKPPISPTTTPMKSSVAACDALAGEEYDRDRPAGGKWQANIFESPLAKALNVCKAALAVVQSGPKSTKDERRIRMEIGRILSAQSVVEAKKGNLTDAKKLFDQARDSLQLSASLGSAHAAYLLGTFYRGDFTVKDTPKGEFAPVKDLKTAWDYFKKAADEGDPVALTTVAFGYLLPNWTDNMVKANYSQGRSYLSKAIETKFPRANFLRGLAMIEGKGFEKNRTEGLKDIKIAYCEKDPSAETYVKNNHITDFTCP